MDWNSSFKYKPSFDTGNLIPRDKYPGIDKDSGFDWGDAFNTKLPSSLTDTKPKNDWGEIFGGLFDKARDTNKYREESQRPSFGESTRGSGGQLLENLSALYPQQHAPMFIPGQTSEGIGGAIGTAVGAIGGSLIPGVGTALGAKIGGGVGSFF
jgi:hypothetical protein